jgi:hypothetical protein
VPDAEDPGMSDIVRVVDSDERSLELRVAAAVARLGGGCAVLRFTHWYTNRPPVYEATVRPSA